MILGFIKILFLLIGFSFGNSPYPVKKEDPKCSDCHKVLVEQPVVHPPVEDCASCHQPGEQQHPVTGTKTFTLVDEMPKICFSCHDESKKAVKHAPAEAGECLTCHIPHNSPNKSLLTESKVSDLCSTCHDLNSVADKSIHKPVAEGNCTGCHDPHESDNAKLVKNKAPELCFTCHEKTKTQAGLKNIHPPFESECSSCHKPHSSAEQKLLVSKAPGLCYECHSDFKEKVDIFKYKHSPVSTGKSCAGCHSPHASNENKFLLLDQKTLCLNCHSKTYKSKADGKIIPEMKKLFKTAKSVHAAVEDGCTGCHNPHGSDFENLLISSFPSTMYVVSTPDNFGLCFTCHDKELIEIENTTSTQFRNGEKNMHYLHINGVKGRNCLVCHNVHAAENLHLINDKMKFGTFDFSLNYKSSENGGSCATACHGEKNYDRLNSFDNKKKRIIATNKKKNSNNKADTLIANTVSEDTMRNEKSDTVITAENKNSISTNENLTKEEKESVKKTDTTIVTENKNSISKNEINDGKSNTEKKNVVEKTDTAMTNGNKTNISKNENVTKEEKESVKKTDTTIVTENKNSISKNEINDGKTNTEKKIVVEKTDTAMTSENKTNISKNENLTKEKKDVTKKDKADADAKKEIEKQKKDEAELRQQYEAEQKVFEKEKEKMDAEKEKKEKLISEELAKIELEIKKKVDAKNNMNKRLDDVSKNFPIDKNRESLMMDSVFASITNELMMEARLDSMLESKLPKIQINKFKFLKTLELNIDFNKIKLISGKEDELIYVLEFLKNYPERKVEIQGHTDNKGSEETNKEVSLKRAEYVRDYLVSKGVKASQITVVGHGFSRPKDTNNTEKGRAKNRRIEFRLLE